jgi:hypothetical protein
VLAGVTQVVLGAAAGAVFHQQLGNARTVREAVQGGVEEPVP